MYTNVKKTRCCKNHEPEKPLFHCSPVFRASVLKSCFCRKKSCSLLINVYMILQDSSFSSVSLCFSFDASLIKKCLEINGVQTR